MDRNTFLEKAAQYFDIPVGLMKAIADVETLTEEEAEEKYGGELAVINHWAEEIGPDWYREVKEWMKEKQDMKNTLNEAQLRQIVENCVRAIFESEDKSRFNKYIEEDVRALYDIYDKWEHATYKPEGMDEVLDKVLEAKDAMEALLYYDIEDFGPYEDEPNYL